jgi:hypothetical protein
LIAATKPSGFSHIMPRPAPDTTWSVTPLARISACLRSGPFASPRTRARGIGELGFRLGGDPPAEEAAAGVEVRLGHHESGHEVGSSGG